jgi:DNA-binding NtrC family response regulator
MDRNKDIRVLLVDDEERFRTTMVATLEKRGFQVKAVAGGVEALEEIRKNNIDVVVLDIMMPGMNGHRVLREINKLGLDLEVIMLTAHASMDSAFEGLHNNVFAYMCKPCDVELLINRIREAVGWRKLRAQGRNR